MQHKVVPSRRQILRGAGGVTLGLPFLPSLLSREALAQVKPEPRFVLIVTEHGGLRGSNMVPADSMLTQQTQMFPNHMIRNGTLARAVNGTNASLSPVLTAPSNVLTDKVVSKMNVLRGFDVHFYIAHHTGGHLGNFAATTGGTDVTTHRITIDQVMAYSGSFYKSLSGIRNRILVAGEGDGLSWGYSNPTARTGTIQKYAPYQVDQIGNLFNAAIGNTDTSGGGGMQPPPPPPSRAAIVDRVLENYRRLRNGNRRLSTNDKQRLDDHMSRIAELQRQINLMTAPPPPRAASCQDVEQYRKVSDIYPRRTIQAATSYYHALVDIMAAAFMCQTSRIALLRVNQDFTNYTGDWHQEIAHMHTANTPQSKLVEGNQRTFSETFARLASTLDSSEEYPGSTFLDNTYMMWSQEAGTFTHDLQHATVVSAGSAGGFFKTGQFIDYRNRIAAKAMTRSTDANLSMDDRIEYPGLSWRQYLGGVLQGMGLPRSDYEVANEPGGYGDPHAVASWTSKISPEVMTRAGEVPMLLKA